MVPSSRSLMMCRARERARYDPDASILCCGKIAIDLLAHESRAHNEDIAIVRVESSILSLGRIEKCPCQLSRVPVRSSGCRKNHAIMGAWNYMFPRLTGIVDHAATIMSLLVPTAQLLASASGISMWRNRNALSAEASSLPLKQSGGKNVR